MQSGTSVIANQGGWALHTLLALNQRAPVLLGNIFPVRDALLAPLENIVLEEPQLWLRVQLGRMRQGLV